MNKLYAILVLLLLPLALAHEDVDAKTLIDSNVPCDQLDDDQLESMGDYYMEQIHPGEAHKLMDNMMGGEGSASLAQMHILMAKRLYCNEATGSSGMMGGGMMNMMGNFGMMGSSGYGMMGSGWFWGLNGLLYTLLLIGLVVLVYIWIVKVWRSLNAKKK
ncbi:hypothetical protein HYX14_03080 [Candidatus Woesearchaeota archaeon]|nr:hypothetical protein [Candidatus Woesearchaeota archaeon]